MAEGLTWAAAAGLWLAVLAVAAARRWWLFELVSHFPLQLLLAALAVGVAAIALGQPVAGVVALAAELPHVYCLAKWACLPGPRRSSGEAAGPVVRLATFNLAYPNHNAAVVDRYVADLKPDIMLLQEAGLDWPGPLSGSRLSHACQALKTTGDHLFLLSRWPVQAWKKARSASTGTPLIVAEIEIGGRPVTIVNFHGASPKTARKARNRNLHFKDLAHRMAEIQGPKIIAGDFNCTPWSPYYRDLIEQLDMVSVAQGRGWSWSWPAVLSFLGIPIDHILISRDIKVRSFSRGPMLGSDHLPLIAELELAPLS